MSAVLMGGQLVSTLHRRPTVYFVPSASRSEASVSKPERRARFVAERAPAIAAAVCKEAVPWSGTMRLSTQFGWFSDGDCLVVVGCEGESPRDLDLGLAFGLAHAGDRELVVILPASTMEPTRRRLPWLDPPVRLYTFDSSGAVEQSFPLAQCEALQATNDPLVTARHELGDRAEWVERLAAWANACPELVEAHRPSYLAWHCRGRMALKIRRIAGGLSVTAGVHHSAPDQAPHEAPLHGPLSAEQFHRLASAASLVIADRLGGADLANAEHQLQERLAALHSALGLARTMREFPAMRPVDRRGYIDLLGVGNDGAIHIVETKIGADPMLVLQGLDYWIWTMAHREEVAAHLSRELEIPLAKKPPVVIDFVVGEADSAFVSPYSASQAEALDGAIAWQFHTITGWEGDNTQITHLGRRRSPPGARASEARYASRLEADLVDRAGSALHRRVFYVEAGGGILPAARPAFDSLQERGLLHSYVDHVRSSQAFALNLFGDLSTSELHSVWHLLEPSVLNVDDVEFEYIDDLDSLGELQPARPHQTQADVVLRGSRPDGRRYLALIEVKLSETQFGSCSAFDSPHNDRRDNCRTPGPWGTDREACFQLRNHDGPSRRHYDDYLQAAWVTPTAEEECPFRALNQPMRNIALARALIDRGDADAALYCLCAPSENIHIWRQWRRAQSLLAAVPAVSLHSLPVERLLKALGTQRREELANRYGLVAQTATNAGQR